MKDPYITPNGVLKNKLNITDKEELKRAEADIGFLKLINVDSVSIEKFDQELIKRIHQHIFSDIYSWAGEFRKVPIVKEEIVLPGYSIPYSLPKNVPKELKEKLVELNSIAWQDMSLKDISVKFAREISLLWRVHPFRDGNTRTILSFSFIYAKEHGFPFDIETLISELNRQYQEDGKVKKYSIRDKFVLACLDEKDYPEVGPLASTYYKAMINYQKKEESNEIRHK